MKRNELGIPIKAFKLAESSTDRPLLGRLARSHDRFVRAAVARNKHISRRTHEHLLADESRGVRMWALEHPLTTRKQFKALFDELRDAPYDSVLHSSLSSHPLASTEELRVLLGRNEWLLNLNILNNHQGRDQAAFKRLIASLVPSYQSESDVLNWEEINFIAYYRYHGVRKWPPHK